MQQRRKYSVDEIKELVQIIQTDPAMPKERIEGMRELIKLLAHFEHMSLAEIEAETIAVYRQL